MPIDEAPTTEILLPLPHECYLSRSFLPCFARPLFHIFLLHHMKRCVQVAPIHFLVKMPQASRLNPGIIQLIGFPSLDGIYGKNSIVFSRLPWPPFLLLSFVLLCFTFAFGALHAPCSFDLGRKEIENQAFCIFAAVPNHHRE